MKKSIKTRTCYTMVGSDFSQQEPRLMSSLSGDETMINAYRQGKDLYATMATAVYKNTYWDNMEHWEDGSANPDGKKRRSSCKKLLLGILYGMGSASIATSIGCSVEEAQGIIDGFFEGFPAVKKWIDESQSNAKKFGYVEDAWGRRRRLPDIQLPKYHVEYFNKDSDTNFNPILGCKGLYTNPNDIVLNEYYQKALQLKYRKQEQNLIEEAKSKGINLHSNGNKIAQAERQCVNARIQGSAASMSKKAMINVYNDEELNKLDFTVLIGVHDELIGECPEENAEAVAERLTYVMKHSAEPDIVVPFKCDPTIEKSWYISDYTDTLINDFRKRLAKNEKSKDEIINDIYEEYCECTKEQIDEMLIEEIS